MAYCEWVTYPDGTQALVRHHGRPPQKPCATCGQPSRWLCDAPLERPVFGESARTCDAPMCEAHRTSVGPDLDHCPVHAAAVVAT